MPKQTGRAIISAALIVGTADILMACLIAWVRNNASPETVLKFIASGLIGRQAFRGGFEAVLLGLVLHYFIALGFTALLFVIYPSLKWVHRNKIIGGVLYGILVWLVMNQVVVPLSATPAIKNEPGNMIISMLVLVIAIGLPLVFLAGRFYELRRKAEIS